MSSLYIDRRGVHVKADGEALVFYENNVRVGTLPMAPLERVFLRGDITLSASLLGKLGERGIGVVVLSGRKATPSLLLARPHNDAARRISQFHHSQNPAFCLRFAKQQVTAKITAQKALLAEYHETDNQVRYLLGLALRKIETCLTRIDACESASVLRGIEGAAAAAYFEGYSQLFAPSLKFTGRNRRPPKDPVNASLSLAYTLLHTEAVLALYGAGLDPFIGFYHTLDFGRESLACDLIEPLRLLADRHLCQLFRKQELVADHFSSTEAEGCRLGKAGRIKFYGQWENLTEKVRKALDNQVSQLIHSLPPVPKAAHMDESQ